MHQHHSSTHDKLIVQNDGTKRSGRFRTSRYQTNLRQIIRNTWMYLEIKERGQRKRCEYKRRQYTMDSPEPPNALHICIACKLRKQDVSTSLLARTREEG